MPQTRSQKRKREDDDDTNLQAKLSGLSIVAYKLNHSQNTLCRAATNELVIQDKEGIYSTTLLKERITVSKAELHVAIRRFESMCRVEKTGGHRDWLKDQTWRTMYQAGKRKVPIIQGYAPGSRSVDTVPCHHCGIVLPTKTIAQLDHVHPHKENKAGIHKGGGHTRAFAKVMRVIGDNLTESPATGARAASLRSPVGGIGPLPTGKPKHTMALPGGQTFNHPMDKRKYTLTKKGMVVAGFLVKDYGVDGVLTRSVNSIVNIVPLCAACNGSGGKGSRVRHMW